MIHSFKNAVCAFLAFVAASPLACFGADLSSTEAAARVSVSLRSAREVELYFLSRTEDWNYNPNQLMGESSIRVLRQCGGNCHRLMEPVLEHLRTARPVTCLEGNQDALIRAKPGVELIYSYSGRHIRYRGDCFFNERGVRSVVGGKSMLFSFVAPNDIGAGANNSFKPKPLRGSA